LDVWPALPLVVEGSTAITPGTDNIIAALGQSDRVCKVELSLGGQELEEVLAAMQVPFPELTQMVLSSDDDSETALVIPDSFLGGSAPRLRTLSLKCIPFPALPKLLLSSTHLVKLCLSEIPHSGYISPEVMVALLPVLSSLKALYLKFRSPESRPVSESRSLPSIKRSILPALTSFDFQGATEYLEELVANIDTPQLNELDITLFNQIGTPRLAQFINRTSLTAGDIAGVAFYGLKVQALVRNLRISILCPEPDRQFSSVTQIYKPLRTLSTVANLQILNDTDEHTVVDAIEDTLWLQLLLPFTALKNLYLPREFAPSIAAALKELVGRRKIEVLLSLENIFVKGFVPYRPLQEIFDQFVAARQLSEHPIAISAGTSGSDAARKLQPMLSSFHIHLISL
jgi:hypothetical protein